MAHNRRTTGRRDEDKCWIKRMYSRFTPYVQFLGWAVVAVPVVISFITLADRARAFDARLTTMEKSQDNYARKQEILITKIDTIIRLVKD